VDYSLFDAFLDSIFVLDAQRKILYCNATAAILCDSSVRRLSKGQHLFEVLTFSDPNLFVMPEGHWGEDLATPFTEVEFEHVGSGRKGKVQICIQPTSNNTQPVWIVMLHDVTLEEVLHGKYRKELEQKERYIHELRQAQKELEDYSKNLERKVDERTAEVRQANQMLSAIMNSLGQGFLVFNRDGECGSVFTKACLEVLECRPAGMKIWEALRLFGPARDQFMKWVDTAFKELLPFDSMVELAPHVFKHSQGRQVTLDYYPLRDDRDAITGIVMVATDKTTEVETAQALEREKQHAQMVMRIIRSRDHFGYFLESTRDLILEMQKLVKISDTANLPVQDLFRKLHTLEGEASAYSVAPLRASARSAQDVLDPLRMGDAVNPQVVLKRLASALRELGSNFNDFLKENKGLFEMLGIEKGRKIEIPYTKVLAFRDHLEKHGVHERVIHDFEDDFLRVPLKACLRHLEEAAVVVAAKQSKQLLPFRFETGAVHVIADSFEGLFLSLVHAVRNAVDHGLEDTDERIALGKPEAGKIVIRGQWVVRNSGRWIKIEIQDDGRGIDPEKIREKLDQRYPGENWENVSDTEVIQRIFEPGFTSRDQAGDFSGRGVGMDAIMNECRLLGGHAVVESEMGVGTTLVIEVPDQSLRTSYRTSA
jgi:two-component system chemotaxis sensor kinase CheA